MSQDIFFVYNNKKISTFKIYESLKLYSSVKINIKYNEKYDHRLSILKQVNPIYAEEIESFVKNNPEFLKVGHILALSEYPHGYNKNPGEKYNPLAPTTIFEHLVYYIACIGVNYDYALKQWEIILKTLRNKSVYQNDMLDKLDLSVLQKKKQQIYKDLCILLRKYEIFPNNSLNYQQVINICKELKGVGQGCVNHLTLFYGDKNNVSVDYTDFTFMKGFIKFYNLQEKPTKKEILKLTSNWSNIKIGNMFMFQCAHYWNRL